VKIIKNLKFKEIQYGGMEKSEPSNCIRLDSYSSKVEAGINCVKRSGREYKGISRKGKQTWWKRNSNALLIGGGIH
jgi:hypothetical protein